MLKTSFGFGNTPNAKIDGFLQISLVFFHKITNLLDDEHSKNLPFFGIFSRELQITFFPGGLRPQTTINCPKFAQIKIYEKRKYKVKGIEKRIWGFLGRSC